MSREQTTEDWALVVESVKREATVRFANYLSMCDRDGEIQLYVIQFTLSVEKYSDGDESDIRLNWRGKPATKSGAIDGRSTEGIVLPYWEGAEFALVDQHRDMLSKPIQKAYATYKRQKRGEDLT